MNANAKAAFEEASRLYTAAKSILDEYDGQDMPQEKQNEADSLLDQAEAKTAEGQRLERAAAMEARINEPVNVLPTPVTPGDGDSAESPAAKDAAHLAVFRKALVSGTHRMSSSELKTLSATNDIEGGYLLAPEQFTAEIIKELDNTVYVRQFANVVQVTQGGSLGVVTLDEDPANPDWTTELAEADVSATAKFGKRQLMPHRLTKGVKISRRLIRQARQNVESYVQGRIAYKFAITQENAFLTGDGHNKPLGMFVASDQGISTSRDVTAASATSIKADELIDMKYTLREPYHRRARWVLHRNILKAVRKLKTNNGDYLWEPGIAMGRPDMLLEMPYIVSEYAPSTITTGDYTIVLGDMEYYMIADSLQLQIQVLIEKYAEYDQTGYIAIMETDGQPILEDAFVRLKQA
jgi:HK97 family phage major capsid protein